jgi:SAM-dependent methyltransferase
VSQSPAAPSAAGHDAATLAFYDREASAYAARAQDGGSPRLDRFLDDLAPGARILELGCGGGRDAEAMLARGFDVTPTDGSPGLAAQTEARLGRPVRLMRFEELEADGEYDAVWANACLLHAPFDALPGILARIHRALKPGGRCFASYKGGEGPDRDGLGRYYNFPTEAALRAAYQTAGAWVSFEIEHGRGGGYDGVARDWLMCLATR